MKFDCYVSALSDVLLRSYDKIGLGRDRRGYIDKLEVVEKSYPERPKDHGVKYFQFSGHFIVLGHSPAVATISGEVAVWWNHNERTMAGAIKWGKDEYLVVAGDCFRSEGFFLRVWPKNPDSRFVFDENLDEPTQCLVRDITKLRTQSGSHLPMRAEVLLNNGDHYIGTLTDFGTTNIVMDVVTKMIGPKIEDIAALWTVPPEKKEG